MSEHLVLIFAYHFPPENAIGAARPYRFSKYLAKLGYACRVFTASQQNGRDDPNTEYVPDPFLTGPRGSLEWQFERGIRKILMPGELGTQWSRRACRAAREYLRAHPGARVTIFSTFPPLGAHLAAWQLARRENLPWIADFRDPLPDWSRRSGPNPFPQHVYAWLERALTQRSDVIIANTDGARNELRAKFPSLGGKVQVIWNGFDPEERIKPLPLPRRDYRVLSHVGYLYKDRTAVPVLESIARLIAAGRLSPARVRVQLVGSAEPAALPSQEFLRRAQGEGWLALRQEKVPRGEALEIARSSDSLLLLQPQSTTQVPGKLFEYLQIGRPILAFVQPDSPSARLLEQSGVPFRCVFPGSAPEAMDPVVAGFFDLSSTPVAPSHWFAEQFNAENQTQALHSLLMSVHSAA